MISFLKTVGFAAFALLATIGTNNANAQEEEDGFQHGVPCTPCEDEPSESCIIKVRVNFFASEAGMYNRMKQECI